MVEEAWQACGGKRDHVEKIIALAFATLAEETSLEEIDPIGLPGRTDDFLVTVETYAMKGGWEKRE